MTAPTEMIGRRKSQLHHTATRKVLGGVLCTQPRPSGGSLKQWHATPRGGSGGAASFFPPVTGRLRRRGARCVVGPDKGDGVSVAYRVTRGSRGVAVLADRFDPRTSFGDGGAAGHD
jgi:hypothetical protein